MRDDEGSSTTNNNNNQPKYSHDLDHYARCSSLMSELGYKAIDINMGCPEHVSGPSHGTQCPSVSHTVTYRVSI